MKDLGAHYDNIYTSPDVFGGGKPLSLVLQIPEIISKGKVLDVGAGQGRNTIFLAERGFDVDAFDVSPRAIKQLKECENELNYHVYTEPTDITSADITVAQYNVVILSFVLHHIKNEVARDILDRWRKAAPTGALHAIATFTSRGEFYAMKKHADAFYPEPGELKELYSDWNIITYEEAERPALQKKEDGTPMMNLTAFLLAQKDLR